MKLEDTAWGTKLSPFFVFREESQDFLFDGGNGVLSKISPLVADIISLTGLYNLYDDSECKEIEDLLSKKYNNVEIISGINVVKRNIADGLLAERDKIYQYYDEDYFCDNTFKGNLWLSVTDSCNLQCSYCFEKDNTFVGKKLMTKDIAKKCIDYWFEYIKKDQYVYDIFFFGGEPLLNQETIIFCVNYINKLLKGFRGIPRYNITTNGTILNEELLTLFKDNLFLINVSIDGLKKIHDNHRPYKSGKETYETVVDNLIQLNQVADKVSAFICMTRKDIRYFKYSVFYLWKLGIKNVYGNLVFGNDQVYSCEDYKEFDLQIKEIGEAVYQNIINDRPIFYNSFVEMMKAIHRRSFALNCYLWQNGIFVFSPDGDAYRCHRFMGDERFVLGNINEDNLNLLSKRIKKKRVEECSQCWYQLYCGDGCPYENDVYTGDINKPSEMQCMRSKITFEESLRLYARLTINYPEKLKVLMGGTKNE